MHLRNLGLATAQRRKYAPRPVSCKRPLLEPYGTLYNPMCERGLRLQETPLDGKVQSTNSSSRPEHFGTRQLSCRAIWQKGSISFKGLQSSSCRNPIQGFLERVSGRSFFQAFLLEFTGRGFLVSCPASWGLGFVGFQTYKS